MVFADFTVQFGEDGLTAVGRGEPIDFVRHEIDTEIKAITWHGLKIEHVEDGLQAEVIVDILIDLDRCINRSLIKIKQRNYDFCRTLHDWSCDRLGYHSTGCRAVNVFGLA